MKITQFVFEGNKAYSTRYFDGSLYYMIRNRDTGEYFEFEIPIGIETQGATFRSEEKALLLMRWIRKAIETDTMKPFIV